MPLSALIPLIIQYGLPFAQMIWQKVTAGGNVTQADFDELNALAAQTPQTHLQNVAKSLGLPMTDPRIVALAALIK